MQSSLTKNPLATVVDEFLMLVQETAEYHRDQDVQAVLREAARILLKTRRKLQLSARRYVVGMVGLTNVGKSTLLNALLGSDLAPRRNRPCTAAPIEFVYGGTYRITACYRQQLQRPAWFCNGVEAVHERLTELADESGAESRRSIHKIVVEAPAPLLANGLILADTPGFGAAQAAGVQGTHEENLRGYLREDVSQVFWVVLAEQGIGKREKSFHDEFFAEVCDDVVVTGCEDWEPLDRERFRRRFAKGMQMFHFVSGLQGLTARAADDSAGLESAGITLLETRIRELSEPAGRARAAQRALIQLADDISYWMFESPTRRGKAMNCLWRPDSWDRWVECGANHELVSDLARRLTFDP